MPAALAECGVWPTGDRSIGTDGFGGVKTEFIQVKIKL